MKEYYLLDVALDKERRPYLVKEGSVSFPEGQLDEPKKLAELFEKSFSMSTRAEEIAVAAALDTVLQLKGLFLVSKGNAQESILDPSRVIIRALLAGATRVVVAHNHPSGRVVPSRADLLNKDKVKGALDLVGLELLDYMVLGNGYYSAKEQEVL